MITTYQYRVYLTTDQKLKLNSWLRTCMYWYNWQLGDRLQWWEQNRCYTDRCPLNSYIVEPRDNPDLNTQKKLLPGLKKDLYLTGSKELLDFSDVPSATLQDVSIRLDKAFKRYLAGDSKGKRSGKPRFKSSSRFRSMVFHKCQIDSWTKRWLWLDLPGRQGKEGIGSIKIRKHRDIPSGSILGSCQLIKKADGWYISMAFKDDSVPTFEPDVIVPTWDNSIGMDAVLHEDDYLALSDNTKIPSLKCFRKNQAQLAKISQKKSKTKKRSKVRRKLAKKEARWHQKVARSRRQHAYETANRVISKGFKVVFHEKLNLAGLSKRNKAKKEDGKYIPNGQSAKSGLNKSWSDAAFAQFFKILEYKAEKAGVLVKAVNPAYTSQVLSYRDEVVFPDCSVREYWDEVLNLLIDRDINSSINIKRVGLDIFPTIKRRKGNIVMEDSKTESTLKQILNLFGKEASLIA